MLAVYTMSRCMADTSTMRSALVLFTLLGACGRSPEAPTSTTPSSLAADTPVTVSKPGTAASVPEDPLSVPALAVAARAAFERQNSVEVPALLQPFVPEGLMGKAVRFDESLGMSRTRLEPGFRGGLVSMLTLLPNAPYNAAVEAHATKTGLLSVAPPKSSGLGPTAPRVKAFERAAPKQQVVFEERAPLGQPRRVDLRVETRGEPHKGALALPPGLPDWVGPLPASLTLEGWERGQYHAFIVEPGNTDLSRWVLGLTAASAEARDEARAALENRLRGDGFEPDEKRPGYFERASTRETIYFRSDETPKVALILSVQRRWRR